MSSEYKTIEERVGYAQTLKRQGGCNCCQAVLLALQDQTGLDDETLKHLGSGFGGGMGNMEGTCGALLGANMALSLSVQKGTLPLSRQLAEGFREACGATRCRDLKQLIDGKPLCSCDDCVRNAVLLYGKVKGME